VTTCAKYGDETEIKNKRTPSAKTSKIACGCREKLSDSDTGRRSSPLQTQPIPVRTTDRTVIPACNFSATITSTTSTYRLGAEVSLKSSAIENMPPISVKLHVVYKHDI